ncbi:Non-specific lipid-transfer protein 2 [Sesamum angolense]|uniref:Non-specific lipid-transfer protein n=1 Tax=Sesamum angolense TaxID=2727404 RepID=A0AAE1X7N0_9LAMI|nr:Non-specific lipid-transfer protein 2 [Sesamum angolense]
MAGTIKPMCIVLIAAILVAAVAPCSEAAIGCGTVVSYLNPCLPYVTNKGPLGSCCSGVKGLYGAAQTTPDRQSVCSCLKSLAGSYKDVDLSKAAGLLDNVASTFPTRLALPLIAQR